MNSRNKKTYSMVLTAMLLAVGLILPFITGNIQTIAKIISPLHIPVLICGLCCGWKWGLGLGMILPLFRSLLFSIPVFPTSAVPMVFELGAYGLLTGMIYEGLLKKKSSSKGRDATAADGNHLPMILLSLLTAMIVGRFIGGGAKALFLALGIIGTKSPFTFSVFFTSYFVSTAPGAVIHLILIPLVVLALEKAKLSPMLMRS